VTDEARVREHQLNAIARDRLRLFGEVSFEEYTIAWARRLIEQFELAAPANEYERRIQSARRAALRLLTAAEGDDPGEIDTQDERNFEVMVNVVPDVRTTLAALGPDRALELLEVRVRALRPSPDGGNLGDSQVTAAARDLEPRNEPSSLPEWSLDMEVQALGEVLSPDAKRDVRSLATIPMLLLVPVGVAVFIAALFVWGPLINTLLGLFGQLPPDGLADRPRSDVERALLLALFVGPPLVVTLLVFRVLIRGLPTWFRRILNW
jgi:hypothetical protein